MKLVALALACSTALACSLEQPDALLPHGGATVHREASPSSANEPSGESSSTSTPMPTPSPAPTSSTAPPPGFDVFQQHNLDVVNGYRAMKGIAPLTLDAKLSAFALAGSQELSSDHLPHQHFITATSSTAFFAAGFSGGAAENQGSPVGWPMMSADPTKNELAQIESIIQAMFGEGPGGGHYEALMSPAHKRIGVGLLEVAGKLYLTNDFSP